MDRKFTKGADRITGDPALSGHKHYVLAGIGGGYRAPLGRLFRIGGEVSLVHFADELELRLMLMGRLQFKDRD